MRSGIRAACVAGVVGAALALPASASALAGDVDVEPNVNGGLGTGSGVSVDVDAFVPTAGVPSFGITLVDITI